ncbi:zinc-binding alcohol dehydrogenase [Microbacterium sp. X-17]|uniref:zinc-binding alcohol dehydrogenase n=1 Tax=Microbacterium sp. X-17 TaxID=3144404 RepID=UPI0031F49E11
MRGAWVIREDASRPVLVALYLRHVLGLRTPADLPTVRGLPIPSIARDAAEQDRLESEWAELWAMTIEPQAHPSPVPLELVDGFDTLLALPEGAAAELRSAIAPHAQDALAYADAEHQAYRKLASASTGASYRAYASAIAEHERQVGRPAHAFELNVQVLPLAQRGVWWIGALTVAVTDGLRGDAAQFDSAIHPIIAELA